MKINRIVFKATGSPAITPGDVTVFVGPNHSGKSQALREIESWLHGDPIPMKVLSNVHLEFPAYEVLEEWLLNQSWARSRDSRVVELSQPSFCDAAPRTMRINLPDDILGWHKSLEGNEKAHTEIRKRTTSWATLRLDASARFEITKQKPMGDLQLQPVHHLGALFKEPEKRREWRDLCSEAFPGFHAVIDHTSPNLRVRMASRDPTNEEETSIGRSAVDYHGSATLIDNVGDGVRAFTGIASILACYDWMYLLIDDPEAFLHPPVARQLGRDLARMAHKKGAQVFASTHSSHFLQGCIDETQDVTIVRLTYDSVAKNGSAYILNAEQTQETLQHPLLNSTRVLDALFHRAVVVTEGETDRMFYDEINTMLQKRGKGHHDCLFLGVQSRDSIALVLHPLRHLGIPAAAIVDLDYLWDGGTKWSQLLEAAGIDEPTKREIDESTNEMRGRMRALGVSRTDFKNKGIQRLPSDLRRDLQSLLLRLDERGVFCVPVGELESWFPDLDIQGRTTKWLIKCIEKIRASEIKIPSKRAGSMNSFEFVDRLTHWLQGGRLPVRKEKPPLRVGVGEHDLTMVSIVGQKNEERLAANVASLMNTRGGTLIIGVREDGIIIGLADDMDVLNLDSTEEFKVVVKTTIGQFIDEWALDFSSVIINPVGDDFICLVEVTRTPEPVSIVQRI